MDFFGVKSRGKEVEVQVEIDIESERLFVISRLLRRGRGEEEEGGGDLFYSLFFEHLKLKPETQ